MEYLKKVKHQHGTTFFFPSFSFNMWSDHGISCYKDRVYFFDWRNDIMNTGTTIRKAHNAITHVGRLQFLSTSFLGVGGCYVSGMLV